MPDSISIQSLREIAAKAGQPHTNAKEQYHIAAPVGPAYLARSRAGFLSLLVPLAGSVGNVARTGGGFTLKSAQQVVFDYDGQRWEQPAAMLECTDDQLTDPFLVLVADGIRRFPPDRREITWRLILAWVEEWQALLSKRQPLTTEQELGLWGELWIIAQSTDVDGLFANWRGPESDAVDFFHDGTSLEVKVSRRALIHHVSRNQVEAPRGTHPSYLISIWVGTEIVRGIALAELVKGLIDRVTDPTSFLKQLARAGYSPQDQDAYLTRYVILDIPRWFRTEDVPQVRAADEGISQLRYVVTLDGDRCLDDAGSRVLWRHFCGREPAT